MCKANSLNNTVVVYMVDPYDCYLSQGVSDACIAWRKALQIVWKLSPITHCTVVALVAESGPLDVCLKQQFCKFSTGIDKYGLDVLKTVVNVAQGNLFCLL